MWRALLSAIALPMLSAMALAAEPTGHRRVMLRVRRGSCLVADCATAAEFAALVDLATLVPEQRGRTRASRSR